MDGYWLSEHKRAWSAMRRGNVVPLRAELLPLTGALSDPRARAIDPKCFERKAPKWLASLLFLLISLALWALGWALWKFVVLLWRWAEPVAQFLASLVSAAVLGMFLIGLGLFG